MLAKEHPNTGAHTNDGQYRCQHKKGADFTGLIIAITSKRTENAVVMILIVQPVLAAIPW
jgi:hypothetical protein